MATRAAGRRTFARIALEGWLPSADLSPNARIHWTTRARLVRDTRMAIGMAVIAHRWPTQGRDAPRRRLTITMHRARLLDQDNAVALCKAVVDGVRSPVALWDDSPRYVDIVVRQVKATGKAWRGTVLELEELEAA